MLRSLLVAAGVAALALAPSAVAAPSGTPAQIASGLDAPWEVVPTGNGRTLVVERGAGVRVFNGDVDGGLVYTKPATARKNLGLVLDPGYATNKLLYLYETLNPNQSGGVDGDESSHILKLRDDGATLTPLGEIFGGIGSDLNHDGGRMVFGPDGKLYVTTGDIHDPARPRNRQNLNGKILRLNPDGTAPPSNPFYAEGGNATFVWSYGHRHPQGLAFDRDGQLWETEHGPSGEAHAPAGASSGNDELNRIVPGGDYGWPTVAGSQTLAGTIPPAVVSGPAPAWAFGDLELGSDGLLYAPALNGQHVHVFNVENRCVNGHGRVFGGQRYRAAVADGSNLWLTTDTAPMKLLRVPLVAGTAGIAWDVAPVAGACPPPLVCPASGCGSGAPTPPPALPAPSTPRAPVTATAAVGTAASRLGTAVRTRGLRSLLRTGTASFKVGGLGAGRLSVRLTLVRPNRKAVTVAVGSARPRSRATITVRTKLTPTGRRTLRKLRTARLRAHVTFTPANGAKVTRTSTTTVRR